MLRTLNLLIVKDYIRLIATTVAISTCLLLPAVVSSQPLGEPILPIPAPVFDAQQTEQISLGRSLFHDNRLSKDNSTSCASCHQLDLAGTDRQPVSTGVGGATGTVNAPTVINSSLNIAQFWDGRAATLEEQAAGPVHNPIEMGSNWDEVLKKLNESQSYRARFNKLYDDGLTAKNIQHAIALFERSLLSLDSPFDRYLLGDERAISEEAKQGYHRFKSYGCIACHQGKNVGGNMYSRMGAVGDYFIRQENIQPSDMGRYNVTGNSEDRHVFKVPSLRLVTLTAPYFHDGSVETLEEAIDTMARYQLGRRVSSEDIALMVKFLETLVGDLHEVEP